MELEMQTVKTQGNLIRLLLNAAKSYGIGLVILAVTAVLIIRGLTSAETSNRAEQERLLNDSIRRAVVSCYAVEGRYPESVAYMTENYGVRVDETKFKVYYYAFGSNIMPDFDVITVS
jgi:uncharacterized protein (DUF4213/DUF364 family)